jgi:hypothetical protein
LEIETVNPPTDTRKLTAHPRVRSRPAVLARSAGPCSAARR